MDKWIPDRKYLIGGLTGILTFVLLRLGELVGVPITEIEATQIASAAFLLVSYFVSPSAHDTIKRLDKTLIEKIKAGEQ